MAINLVKNKDSLIAAWKDVLNDKTDTDWALFGYEGQSNDLKVVSSGSSGIEEMIDDLNSGKIMYAFLKVLDPKTSLPKCVLINWQGEGANTLRKGTCANHVREVANFFTGAHVTINARNEEEIEPQLIIDKVSKSSGSAYSFKAPRGDQLEPTKPVGTNYQRVNPVKEINPEERNQFWIKQEQEERIRQEEEKKKREVERQRLDAELKRREIAESAEREEKNKLRNNQILEIRKAEMLAKSAESKILVEKETERIEKDFEEVETLNKSEMLRQQRNKEAQELIGRSTSNARSIFEQNTAAGQMINKAPEKPIRNSIAKQISDFDNTISNTQNTVFNTQNTVSNTQNTISNTQNSVSYMQNTVSHTQNTVSHMQNTVSHTQNTVSHTQNIVSNTQNNTEIKLNENITSKAYPLKLDTLQQVEKTNNNISKQSTEVNQVENIEENEDSDDQFSTIKRSPKSPDVAVESKKSEVFDADPQNTIINNFDYLKSDMSVSKSKTSDTAGPLRLVTEQQLIDEVVYQDMDEDLGLRARALYDYQAADETEITFDPGDIITHIDQIDEGWWQGLGPDGTSYGLFPANYVELIP